MLYCNVIFFKSKIYGNFWLLIKHDSHWINFTIFTFISEIYMYIYKCLYKILNKIKILTWEKRENSRQVIGKLKKRKSEFEYVKSESMFQRGYPNHALTHLLAQNKYLNERMVYFIVKFCELIFFVMCGSFAWLYFHVALHILGIVQGIPSVDHNPNNKSYQH